MIKFKDIINKNIAQPIAILRTKAARFRRFRSYFCVPFLQFS